MRAINKPKTATEIDLMAQSGQMTATILQLMTKLAEPGISSRQLAQAAAKELKALGGKPAFLGVQGSPNQRPFPDIICISVSEEVQHSIPSDRVLVNGDVVNFDFGVNYQGWLSDSGLTVAVGDKVDPDSQRLLEGTKKALYAGLKRVKAGAKVRSISAAIESVLLNHDLGIVKELTGHGIGQTLHEDPEITNYVAGSSDYRLLENQTIAIEPIATLGSGKIRFSKDGWTIFSADNSLSAQFEHTVLVTKNGYRILTQLHS